MILYILILFGFFMRLIPHMPNFAPIAAIALFAGVYLKKKYVPWVPLAIMIISDLVVGMHDMVLFTWGSFILIGFIGLWLRERKSVGNVVLASVFSALLFFVISNLGVWLVWYPNTLSGLASCYIKAIPFLRNTMAGNLVFSFVLFGSYEVARKFVAETKYKTVLLAG